MATQQRNECTFCLETAQARGGVPLMSPGCCGAWFHQTCVHEYAAKLAPGSKLLCPLCRAEFSLGTAVPPAIQSPTNVRAPPPPPPVNMFAPPPPPRPVQQVQQQVQQQQAPANPGIFGNLFPRRNAPAQAPATTGSQDDPASTTTAGGSAREQPNITLDFSPEFPAVSTGFVPSFRTRVGVNYAQDAAAAAKAESTKTPTDIICVLDTSGSMGGEKIRSLQNAMEFVVFTLGSEDRLSVVEFNSNATLRLPFTRMNDNKKNQARGVIQRLSAGGGTDIYAGMNTAWQRLQSRTTRNPATAMFLLTDGQDGSNMSEKLALARRMRAAGISLFVFGFGADHDSDQMNAIATAAEGPFCYIDTNDTVVDAFGGTIGTLQGCSVVNLRLTVLPCQADIRICQVLAGQYIVTDNANGSKTVTFLNLFPGEKRSVIVEYELPAIENEQLEYAIANTSLLYNVPGDASDHSARESIIQIQRLAPEHLDPKMVRDAEVEVQMLRFRSIKAIADAVAAADRNDYTTAREGLQAMKNELLASGCYRASHPIAVGLLKDIDDALLKVRSRDEYERGGKAAIWESVTTNRQERQVYAKSSKANVYQTASSNVMQARSAASKPSKGGFFG